MLIDPKICPNITLLEPTTDALSLLFDKSPFSLVLYFSGGKGRTGTMICVWLVEAGVFSTATQSLDYFGNRRTDTNVSKKFQGVSFHHLQ